MYPPHFAAFAVTLLCIPGIVQSLPTSSGSALITRGEDVPDNLKPVLQDDGLPDGDPNDALIDDDLDDNNSHDNDDYDPDQDQTTNAKRLLVRGVRAGTTHVLRAIGFNKKPVREAFMAADDKRFVGIKQAKKGPRNVNTAVSTFETKRQLPTPGGQKQWQADHVYDLGILSNLAKADKPAGVKDDAWKTVQEAVFGDEPQNGNGDGKANDNTQALALIINAPQNIRGISYNMNQIKNWIMRWAYTTNTNRPDFYKNQKTRRSNVWGALVQLKQTQSQFDDTRTKLAAELKTFIKNDDDSAKAVEKYINDGSSAYLTKAVNELSSALKDPPSADDDKKVFTTEDCSNTSDSPIQAADDSSQPALPAPTPTPAAPTPAPTPPAVDTCGTSYKFLFDTFTITGNFDVGDNGENLRTQVSGCDGLTDWKFTGSSPAGWTATGHTLVGNKACIGRAVLSAGGATKDACHGAG